MYFLFKLIGEDIVLVKDFCLIKFLFRLKNSNQNLNKPIQRGQKSEFLTLLIAPQQNSVSIEKWLTPTLAPRPLWPHEHFGPTLRGDTILCSRRVPANKRKLCQKESYETRLKTSFRPKPRVHVLAFKFYKVNYRQKARFETAN